MRGLTLLASKVLDDATFSLANNDVNVDRLRLPEPPATTDKLVILFVRVRWEYNHVRAVLPIQSPCSNFRLNNQSFDFTLRESGQRFLFGIIGHRAFYLHAVGYRLFQQVAFGVQFAPQHSRTIYGDCFRSGNLAPFPQAVPTLGAFFSHIVCGHRKQHSVAWRFHFNDGFCFNEWR